LPTKPETAVAHRASANGDVLVDVNDVAVHFQLRGGLLSRLMGRGAGTIKAVDGVDVQLRKGEVLGLVGESGSGKTTLGRALLGLVRPTDGSIWYGDRDLATLRRSALRDIRRDIQMVFQDPNAALNPSMNVETAVGHPLKIHGLVKSKAELRQRVREALERVGLSPVERFLTKYPSDLSGGQKQRVVFARAIILDPKLLVADEPVSMLDMSVRAKILQLMLDLKADLDLTYVYITHDLASAKFFCDRVAIMYLGRIVEIGPTAEIFAEPRHPYTKSLLAAIPEPDPDKALPRELPRGEIPDAAEPPAGCSFHPRCPAAFEECGWEGRDLRALIEQHWTRLDESAYAKEQDLLREPEDDPAKPHEILLRPAGGHSTDDIDRLVARIRTEDPNEPLWRGVESTEATADGVLVRFHQGSDPKLRGVGGVEVACHLY
jgi:oligopeptide/dipeptide ABC transporter ATP-binding protein